MQMIWKETVFLSWISSFEMFFLYATARSSGIFMICAKWGKCIFDSFILLKGNQSFFFKSVQIIISCVSHSEIFLSGEQVWGTSFIYMRLWENTYIKIYTMREISITTSCLMGKFLCYEAIFFCEDWIWKIKLQGVILYTVKFYIKYLYDKILFWFVFRRDRLFLILLIFCIWQAGTQRYLLVWSLMVGGIRVRNRATHLYTW